MVDIHQPAELLQSPGHYYSIVCIRQVFYPDVGVKGTQQQEAVRFAFGTGNGNGGPEFSVPGCG